MKKLLTIGILSVSLCTFTKEVYPSSQDLERVMNLFTEKKNFILYQEVHTNIRGKLWSNERETKLVLDTLISQGKIKPEKWYFVKIK